MTSDLEARSGARHSIAARLSLMLAAVFLAVIGGIGLHLYASLGRELSQRAWNELHEKIELVRHTLSEVHSVREIAANREHFDAIIRGQHPLVLAIFDAEGAVLLEAGAVGRPDPALLAWIRRQIAAGKQGEMRHRDGTEYLVRTAKGRAGGDEGAPVWIALATDVRDFGDLLATHGEAMLIAVVLGGSLAWFGAIWVIHRGLAPLRRLAAVERRVSASHMKEERISLADTPLELESLVHDFNGMLERLDDSFRRISEFSSNLAHELRSPINGLIGRAQVTLSRPRSAEEYRTTIESIAEEGERVARIVRDMLYLAKADNASAAINKERVDLRMEAENVKAYFDLLAEERGVTIACDGQAQVLADRDMVQRAIGNLLSNALWRTPYGGTIRIGVRAAAAGAISLEVSNSGPSIAAEHLPRIFDRFYRADRSGASGLGLAIVKSIMDLHGGSVEVTSPPAGMTTFELKFNA